MAEPEHDGSYVTAELAEAVEHFGKGGKVAALVSWLGANGPGQGVCYVCNASELAGVVMFCGLVGGAVTFELFA